MSSKSIKILATVVVIAGALGGLMYTSLAEGTEYYKHAAGSDMTSSTCL